MNIVFRVDSSTQIGIGHIIDPKLIKLLDETRL